MTDKEKLARLIGIIKNTVPYITATMSIGNTLDIDRYLKVYDPNNAGEWLAIHKGRAHSFSNQLEHLLRLAQEMENV